MKFLEKIFDKARHDFEPGGKFERLYPLFEAKETFLFVTNTRTANGAHIRDHMDSKRLMSLVIKAMIPCLIFGIWNVGYQHFQLIGEDASLIDCFLKGARHVIPIVAVTYAVGGTWELIFAVVRKHEINEGFLVTGMLIPLVLPPTLPLWMVAVGVSFGVVIGKEVFGGTGMNIFNPALTARAFLFFAFPVKMSGDKPWVVSEKGLGFQMEQTGLVAQSTPLAETINHSQSGSSAPVNEVLGDAQSWFEMFLGIMPGSIGETSVLLCILGAGILIATGVGSWRIMAATFVGAMFTASLLLLLAPSASSNLAMAPHWHIVIGGFAFGLVFMATDPVSAAQTDTGKLVYGFLIGVCVIIIRAINPAYPEGMMLAILFMNAFAPLIDHYVIQAHIARRRKRHVAAESV